MSSLNSISPRTASDKSCNLGCMNGGVCLKIHGEQLCLCPNDFVGMRCEDTYVALFSHSQNNKHSQNNTHSQNNKPSSSSIGNSLAVGVAIATLLTIVLLIAGIITWRRISAIRKKRRWIKYQQTKRQTKSTIEGFSVIEPSPATLQKPRQSSLGFQLLKSITCKKIFKVNYEPTTKDVEMYKTDQKPEWIATISTDQRRSSLPSALTHSSSDREILVILRQGQISFLSYAPGQVNKAFSSENLTTIDETESAYDDTTHIDQIVDPGTMLKPEVGCITTVSGSDYGANILQGKAHENEKNGSISTSIQPNESLAVGGNKKQRKYSCVIET